MYYTHNHDRVYHIHDIIQFAYILIVLHFKHKLRISYIQYAYTINLYISFALDPMNSSDFDPCNYVER